MDMRFFASIFMKLNLFLTLYYSLKFQFPFLISRGSIVSIKKGAQIVTTKKARLFLGFNTVNNRGAVLQLDQNSILNIKGTVNIFSQSKVVVMENACLSVGERTFFNEGVRVQCRKRISIGDDCAFSWGGLIIDSDFHGIYTNGQVINHDKPVEIGGRVWLGAKSTIQKGAQIENDVIIGSHSLVLKGNYDTKAIFMLDLLLNISLHTMDGGNFEKIT